MRLTFRKKALYFMVTILVLVSSAHTYVAINAEKDIIRTEIIKRAEAIAALATKTGELPILSRNPELLKRAAAFLRGDPESVFIAFYDRRGRLLLNDGAFADDTGANLPPPAGPDRSVVEKKDRFEVLAPVVSVRPGGDVDILQDTGSRKQVSDTIGWVRLGFSKASMKKAEKGIVVRGLMLGLIFLSGSGIMVYLLITLATKPLVSLAQAVRRIEAGEYPEIEPVSSRDEIGELSRAFDKMSRAIKDREARLVSSEKKIRDLFERVEHAIFRVDADGNIIETNKQFDDLCGGTGRFNALFSYVERGMRLLKAAPQGFKNSEERIIGKNGNELITLMSIYPDLDEQGRLKGFDGFFVDITDKKRLEENLIQSQKMDSLGLLAGGIAHDFNNILSGVLGYATLVRSKLPQTDALYKYMDIIVKSTKRAAGLTRQLLGFARKGKYRVERLNINELAKELISFLRETFDRNIVIVTDLARGLPFVEGDGNQIYQAVLNLCLNARDAMPEGGRLYIHTDSYLLKDEKAAHISQVPPGEYVRIHVTDTGTGMSPEVKNKIFEPFYTTKEVGKGTGLGLAMVYGIVKNHGGYITVYSEPGLGTTIRIYLPKLEAVIELEQREKPVNGKAKKGTVLIIDDEEVMRELAKDILSAYDYDVLLAVDGEEGASVYSEHRDRIDLVVLDMIMPKKSGKQAYQNIKLINPDAKVLICSGYGEERYLNEMMEQGVIGFLQKPFQYGDLLSKVKEAMGK